VSNISVTDRVDDGKGSAKHTSGWKIAGFVVLGMIAVGLCAVVGYVVYTKMKETSRKRFYWALAVVASV